MNFGTRSDETVGKIFDGINKNWGQNCSSVAIATVVFVKLKNCKKFSFCFIVV